MSTRGAVHALSSRRPAATPALPSRTPDGCSAYPSGWSFRRQPRSGRATSLHRKVPQSESSWLAGATAAGWHAAMLAAQTWPSRNAFRLPFARPVTGTWRLARRLRPAVPCGRTAPRLATGRGRGSTADRFHGQPHCRELASPDGRLTRGPTCPEAPRRTSHSRFHPKPAGTTTRSASIQHSPESPRSPRAGSWVGARAIGARETGHLGHLGLAIAPGLCSNVIGLGWSQ